MEAGSRAVHAFTQLRIREQALRGKRARPSEEEQLLKACQLKSRRMQYASCADRWDKDTTFQEQMESGSHNRKIGKLGLLDSNDGGTARATNPELYASNYTEGTMSVDRNLAIRKKLWSIPNSISHPSWPINGDQRMPLQHAPAGER